MRDPTSMIPHIIEYTQDVIGCPFCHQKISIPTIENRETGNRYFLKPGMKEVEEIFDSFKLSRDKDYEIMSSLHKQIGTLMNRVDKFSTMVAKHGMFTADESLLKLVNEINRGEHDQK